MPLNVNDIKAEKKFVNNNYGTLLVSYVTGILRIVIPDLFSIICPLINLLFL